MSPHDENPGARMDGNGVDMIREVSEKLDATLLAVEDARAQAAADDEDFERIMGPLREAREAIRVAFRNHLEGP